MIYMRHGIMRGKLLFYGTIFFLLGTRLVFVHGSVLHADLVKASRKKILRLPHGIPVYSEENLTCHTKLIVFL